MLAHRLQPWLSSNTALAKGCFCRESPAPRYNDAMLDQCWGSVIDDGTHLTSIGSMHHVDLLQTAGYPSKHKTFV